MPSIVAQSRPAAFAVAFRFEANFGESRSAGGVGSGSCELSQIVAALGGPSISGAGAGFNFGTRIVRSFVCFQPRAALAAAFAESFGLVVPARTADASGVEDALGFLGGVGSAASWSTLSSADAVASELVSAGAATADASPVAAGVVSVVVVVVVSLASCWLSSPLRGFMGLSALPATAASDAPAKKSVV